jgi:hypothetical protein
MEFNESQSPTNAMKRRHPRLLSRLIGWIASLPLRSGPETRDPGPITWFARSALNLLGNDVSKYIIGPERREATEDGRKSYLIL